MVIPMHFPKKQRTVRTWSCKELQDKIKQLQDEKVRNGGTLDDRGQAELDRFETMFKAKNCTNT